MYKTFEKLKKQKGVTSYQVAKATGISTVTFTDWKYGRYTPKTDKLLKIAKFFGVTLDELVKE